MTEHEATSFSVWQRERRSQPLALAAPGRSPKGEVDSNSPGLCWWEGLPGDSPAPLPDAAGSEEFAPIPAPLPALSSISDSFVNLPEPYLVIAMCFTSTVFNVRRRGRVPFLVAPIRSRPCCSVPEGRRGIHGGKTRASSVFASERPGQCAGGYSTVLAAGLQADGGVGPLGGALVSLSITLASAVYT